MISTTPRRCEPAGDLAFLRVDDFLADMVGARALKAALALGLIDRLSQDPPVATAHLERDWSGDRPGLQLLLGLLAANRVIDRDGDEVRLTREFGEALQCRDLLEAKLDFADLVAPDLIGQFTRLIADPGEFMRRARIFELFGYHRCFEATPENLEATRRWMRFTTCLTRYEARACLHFHDFGRYARMLDIGGNSGEFILQACKCHPHLQGTVLDLPVVCEVGREHVRREPEAGRIRFLAANALVDPLPSGFDLIAFKSMLHDWPEPEAARLLARAGEALAPGGTLMIFERAPLDLGDAPVPYGMIPMLLFYRSFRDPSFYREQLGRLGFARIEIRTVLLEVPFFLLTASRGE